MFDELNRSFVDLDNSLLLQSDLEPLETEFSERGFELDDTSDNNKLTTFSQYTESCTQSSRSDRQILSTPSPLSRHPRYHPIKDNGITYTFESDPLLYKKIRKLID